MPVQAPDYAERENPQRNFVGGSHDEGRVVWIKATDPTGKVYKLNQDNASDWRARGPGYRVHGLWKDAADTQNKAESAPSADEAETEDATDDTATQPAADPTYADIALQELIAMRTEAVALGVKVNDQWGKRRLRAEIDAAKLRAKQGG